MHQICYRDDTSGEDREIEGRTLQELSELLEDVGYDGSRITVRDERDFVVGWVSAGSWSYA
jgi:hypothetical protein